MSAGCWIVTRRDRGQLAQTALAEHTQLNSDSICARVLALNQREAAQAEANQLRAQVAALEAEVARLREPVGLVWQSDGDGERIYSQTIDGQWYEVCVSSWGGFYPVHCGEKTRNIVNKLLNAGSQDLAKAACATHHAARYREMQAKPEPKDTP